MDGATRFVVKRLNWAEEYGGKLVRRPGEVAVVSFTTRADADAECATREAAFRKAVNPFDCGPAVHYWTHLDEPRLRDWLMDHGITPPEPNGAWAGWWKMNQKELGPDKRAAVWEALDKVRFFAVREEAAKPVGYAVVRINWQYNDEYYDAHAEQGEVVQVFRTRERAQAECDECNGIARDAWSDVVHDAVVAVEGYGDTEFAMFDMRDRVRRRRGLPPGVELKKGEGLFRNTDGVPFYEVVEVELEGLP